MIPLIFLLLASTAFAEPPSAADREFSDSYTAPEAPPLTSSNFNSANFNSANFNSQPFEQGPTYQSGTTYYAGPPASFQPTQYSDNYLPATTPGFSLGFGLDFGSIISTGLKFFMSGLAIYLFYSILKSAKQLSVGVFDTLFGNEERSFETAAKGEMVLNMIEQAVNMFNDVNGHHD